MILNVKLICVGYGNNGIFLFFFLFFKFFYWVVVVIRKRKNVFGFFIDIDNKNLDWREIRVEILLEGGKNLGFMLDRNGWRSDWGRDESWLFLVIWFFGVILWDILLFFFDFIWVIDGDDVVMERKNFDSLVFVGFGVVESYLLCDLNCKNFYENFGSWIFR